MSDRVSEAMDAVLAALRDQAWPLPARRVIDAVAAVGGYDEREVRAAVWFLIDRGAVQLTRDRGLALREDARGPS